MVRRLFNCCLLRPEDLRPSHPELEVVGAFNPGVIEHHGEVVLLVRVAERPREKRPGFVGSPRYVPGAGLIIDWIPEEEVVFRDPRAVEYKANGNVRLTFISHLRVVRSRDGRTVDGVDGPRFEPETEMEEYGVEDPRISQIDGTCYFTYVAVSRHGACTALASTQDFRTFTRHGVIFPCENKDVVLFPKKVGPDYAALHRPNPQYHFSPPEIWIAYSADLLHWGRHQVVHGGTAAWETGRVGGGVPPLLSDEGWVTIYHGHAPSAQDDVSGVGEYVAGALLLDRDDPSVVIGQTPDPVLMPEADFEKEGFLGGVVFPTGIVDRDDVLQLFYGAADSYTAVVELSRRELFDAIKPL